jgi:hypothetical protein
VRAGPARRSTSRGTTTIPNKPSWQSPTASTARRSGLPGWYRVFRHWPQERPHDHWRRKRAARRRGGCRSCARCSAGSGAAFCEFAPTLQTQRMVIPAEKVHFRLASTARSALQFASAWPRVFHLTGPDVHTGWSRRRQGRWRDRQPQPVAELAASAGSPRWRAQDARLECAVRAGFAETVGGARRSFA